jgi:CRISPR system Cascade subunit CasD
MHSPVLLLRLEGPLQSWGVRARWDVRDTQPEPTKSGVMGLLGCALGYPIGDPRLEELDRGLRMGVRVESAGEVMEDYHTVTDFLPTASGSYRHSGVATSTSLERLKADPDAVPATIISPRFYLQDAAFLVALEETGEVPELLTRCEAALRDPVWPVFLGRKACVATRPVLVGLTSEYGGIAEALAKQPWEWRARPSRREAPETLQLYLEEGAAPCPAVRLDDRRGPLTRQDRMRVNPTRLYDFRAVRPATVPFPDSDMEGTTS